MVRLSSLAFGLLALSSQVSAAGVVKVMPFGASIVSRCWRANLQTLLKSQSITNFDMVGSQTSKCSGAAMDQNHEGHPGSLATDFAKNGNLVDWLDQNPPDVVIMLIGTNDVLAKKTVDDVLHAYDILLGQMRAKNENMQIVFSNLLPLDPARFSQRAVDGIKALNTAIAAYAPSKSTLKSPVWFVDNFADFDAVKDTDDGEHPNLSTGVQKMANKFLDATKSAIRAADTLKRKRSVRRVVKRD
ncbi:Cellulose-binding family II bacterial type [Pyrenophora teres f. maculata]|nr:Cellulose-binding family II bacterial type [Pyrenophora teres f. maculata]